MIPRFPDPIDCWTSRSARNCGRYVGSYSLPSHYCRRKSNCPCSFAQPLSKTHRTTQWRHVFSRQDKALVLPPRTEQFSLIVSYDVDLVLSPVSPAFALWCSSPNTRQSAVVHPQSARTISTLRSFTARTFYPPLLSFHHPIWPSVYELRDAASLMRFCACVAVFTARAYQLQHHSMLEVRLKISITSLRLRAQFNRIQSAEVWPRITTTTGYTDAGYSPSRRR